MDKKIEENQDKIGKSETVNQNRGFLILGMLLYILTPFLLYLLLREVYKTSYEEFGTQDGWLGFLGGYCGVGGALLIAYVSSYRQRKQFEENLKEEKERFSKETELKENQLKKQLEQQETLSDKELTTQKEQFEKKIIDEKETELKEKLITLDSLMNLYKIKMHDIIYTFYWFFEIPLMGFNAQNFSNYKITFSVLSNFVKGNFNKIITDYNDVKIYFYEEKFSHILDKSYISCFKNLEDIFNTLGLVDLFEVLSNESGAASSNLKSIKEFYSYVAERWIPEIKIVDKKSFLIENALILGEELNHDTSKKILENLPDNTNLLNFYLNLYQEFCKHQFIITDKTEMPDLKAFPFKIELIRRFIIFTKLDPIKSYQIGGTGEKYSIACDQLISYFTNLKRFVETVIDIRECLTLKNKKK